MDFLFAHTAQWIGAEHIRRLHEANIWSGDWHMYTLCVLWCTQTTKHLQTRRGCLFWNDGRQRIFSYFTCSDSWLHQTMVEHGCVYFWLCVCLISHRSAFCRWLAKHTTNPEVVSCRLVSPVFYKKTARTLQYDFILELLGRTRFPSCCRKNTVSPRDCSQPAL